MSLPANPDCDCSSARSAMLASRARRRGWSGHCCDWPSTRTATGRPDPYPVCNAPPPGRSTISSDLTRTSMRKIATATGGCCTVFSIRKYRANAAMPANGCRNTVGVTRNTLEILWTTCSVWRASGLAPERAMPGWIWPAFGWRAPTMSVACIPCYRHWTNAMQT